MGYPIWGTPSISLNYSHPQPPLNCHEKATTKLYSDSEDREKEMAPKKESQSADSHGMFSGMAVMLVGEGVQARRLQIWKQKLMQMGASIEDRFSRKVTHVFAMDSNSLLKELDRERLIRYKTKVLLYQWLESSLREGKAVPEDLYVITLECGGGKIQTLSAEHKSCSDEQIPKKSRISSERANVASPERNTDTEYYSSSSCGVDNTSHFSVPEITSEVALSHHDNVDITSDSSFLYKPPDLNKNVTEIFGKLISIYRALGDDRRSFSYSKAISVIEKLPFKIVNVAQVKHLPSIGKSMQDHIMEIVTTGKLSKLENFEKDEKVRTINLFGEVWGIGPVTAIKLYEKGHRTLDDLKNEESLINSQKLGLKYFQDIKTRIPRQEIEEMEELLQKAGEEILPGVMILCGGSYRRGKESCGDMDIIITHSDGKSHIGFLSKYVKHLKDMNFLREDLVFSVHSEEGTDSGVDTYFGLCTYPGRELRHRIDFKVYPRDIYAFGLIAWTGNDVLNRRLRLLAETKGFRLDDTGLFPVTQSSHRKQGIKGASLKFDTEKQVFDFLGFPWLEPHQRNL